MSNPTLTPLTQALSGEAPIPRRELKALMRRSNRPGFVHLALWLATLGATGLLVWLALGSWWLLPAMFLHGIVVVHHFSLQHECAHYSPFRWRRFCDVVGACCGFLMVIPPRYFRYEHCDHHTHTNLRGKDSELIELPASIPAYLAYLSGAPYWRGQLSVLWRSAFGRFTEEELGFIPKVEVPLVVLEGRAMLAGYGLLGAAMLGFGWWAPLWFWVIPMVMAQPVMRAIRMTEHVGRPQVADFRRNSRTSLVVWPLRMLCWNMNYHAEHHYAASVPFHALPKLHEKLRGHIHVEPRGYLGAHLDILSRIRGRRSCLADPLPEAR